MTIYILEHQSVDPDEAGDAGWFATESRSSYEAALDYALNEQTYDVDTEHFVYIFEGVFLPPQNPWSVFEEYVENLIWGLEDESKPWYGRPITARHVVVGKSYPGGEARRIAQQIKEARA